MNKDKIIWSEFYSKAAHEVPLMYFLYWLATPFIKLFISLKVKPSQITTLSNIFFILSLFALHHDSILPYICFSLLALIFDHCDGVVARFTKSSSKQGAFYDHFSDLLKIVIGFLFLGIINNEKIIWILVYSNMSVFLLMSVVNYMHALLPKSSQKNDTEIEFTQLSQSAIKVFFNKRPKLKRSIIGIHNSLFSIYGNFMLYFLFFGLKGLFLKLILIWILIVILKSFKNSFKNYYTSIKLS